MVREKCLMIRKLGLVLAINDDRIAIIIKHKQVQQMLLSYVVSCLYILTLGVYWTINFAKLNKVSERGFIPGILISLICLCALLLLITVSIVYFCYLRYKVRLNLKQIVSKTMNHTNKVFIMLMCIDIALGIVVYVFTVLE